MTELETEAEGIATLAIAEQERIARAIRLAYDTGPIPSFRQILRAGDAVGAYGVQQINTTFWQGRGRNIVGRKIGLTAAAVQAQLGVDQPDYGVLFDDMRISNRGDLDPARLLQAKVEAEIAFVLAHDLDNDQVTEDDVAAATGHVVAALEIVDSRIADWKITFADTVADNGSSAFFVLGDVQHPLDREILTSCKMVLTVNGELKSHGEGAACLGSPLTAATWLARRLAANHTALRAGDIVLTGALGPMVTLQSDDEVKAEISDIGSVQFRYGGNA